MASAKKSIAVLTSGGDAQGMNAAVRGVTRMALNLKADVYAVMYGYQGMVDDNFQQLHWSDVGGILNQGGTFIGTARCTKFVQREGRKDACRNMLKHGIDTLVVVGGDGSLTGADALAKDWPELVREILQEEPRTVAIPVEDYDRWRKLTVVGFVGSIDNDFCGTDFTIGADTALNRIIDAIDALTSTAASHQREFVVEVMGRNCGWLAIMASISTGSDFVLIPECPPPDDWRVLMCDELKKGKAMGRKSSIVIMAEGARDQSGRAITSQDVNETLNAAGFESRVTILGHVQRGGSPTAFDRNMSTVLGAKAVELALLDPPATPKVLGVRGLNHVVINDLQASIDKTRAVPVAIKEHDYIKAMRLRGCMVMDAWAWHLILSRRFPSPMPTTLPPIEPPGHTRKVKRFGIMNVGACSPGMNAVARALARFALNNGHSVLGIRDGWDGLINDRVRELDWMTVNGWAKLGGALLGTRRISGPAALDPELVAAAIERHQLTGIIAISGWTNYECVLALQKAGERVPTLKNFPICLIPCSVSNNLPCSEYSIGCDTALNNVVSAIDKIKQSAASANRVFIIEVMGTGGWLTTECGMACGAEHMYMPEIKMTLGSLQRDIDEVVDSFRKHQHRHTCLIINNEQASKVFNTQTLSNLFQEHGGSLYAVRTATIGHLQQGGSPTGLDRILSVAMAYRAIEQCERPDAGSGCIGYVGGEIRFTPASEMVEQMDLKARCSKNKWWLNVEAIAEIYAQPAPEVPRVFGRLPSLRLPEPLELDQAVDDQSAPVHFAEGLVRESDVPSPSLHRKVNGPPPTTTEAKPMFVAPAARRLMYQGVSGHPFHGQFVTRESTPLPPSQE
eukprot:TRINITY_DN10402_c0_g1_i1.p1 TRINITY_DN10402_c0_g1~~TRINITY_DN10402_c0_g1_i1.p1  ORF type:complete len:851 (-),score=283.62 TRINITY_DN10402_c0_g1_i1:437-2989(-)